MNLPLKIALIEAGIRQIELSRAINVDPSKLSKIVNGWLEATPGERKAIAKYLQRTEEDIFPKPDII